MTQVKETLNFESFRHQVIEDYRRAFLFKKNIDARQWTSFYRQELLLSVVSKFSKPYDLVYNLPFKSLSPAGMENMTIQGKEIAKKRDFIQNISVINGMFLAGKQFVENDDMVVFAGISVAGMTEIDFLKMMENLSESKLPVNILLLNTHKANGDFFKVRDYFEPKSEHTLKLLVPDVTDYQSIYRTLSEGIVTTRATSIPTLFYPVEKLINQVEYFSEETEPLKKIRSWMLLNKIATEKEIVELEEQISSLVLE